ncbi:hypothetical protein BT63DRAFT_462051 [Microthyrium microscopicum]|uniref:Uncharacterized protein n=1 Tax=Microthyrium microscopicum TaxID=703497 RepID=A0A6A6UTQ8_9PEZI|nr:hypothetical protein BT63DRAFT_462051 [Microthyrium microscopicum]
MGSSTSSLGSRSFDEEYGIEHIEKLVKLLRSRSTPCCVIGAGAMRYYGMSTEDSQWVLLVKHDDVGYSTNLRDYYYEGKLKKKEQDLRGATDNRSKAKLNMITLYRDMKIISSDWQDLKSVLDLVTLKSKTIVLSNRKIPYPEQGILQQNRFLQYPRPSFRP